MNNCRVGLYSFLSTSCWLGEKGVASPPSLVALGLTLPDSRMLSGIASIGLTLINIAIILPHLRQPILDSVHAASESAPAREQSIQEQVESSLEALNATQSVSLNVECLVLASILQDDAERQSPPLPCSATVKSACSAATGPPEALDVDIDAGPPATLLPTANDDDLTSRSPDTGFSPRPSSLSFLLARGGRDALHIPLPVPDDLEVAFFDATDAASYDDGLGEACPVVDCNQDIAPAEPSTTEYHDVLFGESVEQIGQRDAANRLRQTGHDKTDEDLRDMETPGTNNNIVPNETMVAALMHHEPAAEGTVSHPRSGVVACGVADRTSQVGHSGVRWKETLAKQRPESLQFIPQSVINRYPSALTVSENHCFGHRAIISGHDHQSTPITPDILVEDPGMLGGAIPQATYTTLEGQWRGSFLPGSQRRTLVIQAIPAQDHLMQGLTSLLGRPTERELTPHRKRPTDSRQLGVLARAALRNRRACCAPKKERWFRCVSSADESTLPHILGTDLIAAIDSNSESELNLVGSRKTLTKPMPLDVYGDFPSYDSAADVSMMMHVSSIDGASDGEVKVPAAFRPRSYEDIQQWASGVVQKCVRQVCRNRTHVEPRSPSQVSDVCAEKPSGSGISKCPLSGLHCKLGHVASASTKESTPRTKELQAPLTPVSLSNRTPLSVRNVRDIPEFVPRQRQVSVVPLAGQLGGPRRSRTRSAVDVTRDAATEVIARMESQAGFNTRQWVVGMDERRITSTVGGLQRTLRCA
ncbi:hypothetical protein JVU11DRAFT_2509 [Chiua virens]|nr:hypothetical protein JVU11DRAFT_2509 [Chiua virens]